MSEDRAVLPAAGAAERAARAPGSTRDSALDWLRGAVMALMVLDHARDFWHGFRAQPTNLSVTTPLLFGTRWVTHFCAPVFVFLAGTAAYLYAARRTPRERTRFLLSRGLFLVLLEIMVIRFGWIPDLSFRFFVLQVIWVIGWSMVVLALLAYLPRGVVLGVGLTLVLGHNLLDPLDPQDFGSGSWLLVLLHERGSLKLADRSIFVTYPLVPWAGVMALGYAFGPAVQKPPEKRRGLCLWLGGAAIFAFIVLRTWNGYGDPLPRVVGPDFARSVMSFLNTEKYPPSLDYLLMTLGPALVVLAFAPALAARFPAFVVFGQVPLLFYVAHLFLLRYLSLPFGYARFGELAFLPPPRGTLGSPEYPLWVVYLIWIATLFLLYPLCRVYGRLKAERKSVWLSYL